MGRAPCCEKVGLKKGPWTPEEDQILVHYVNTYGHSNWRALPKQAGLPRCGKSCRLRWINYLKPDIKRGNFTREEEDTIIKLHEMLGNRWSAIAARLPGRTDNEIKNVWHTHLKKRLPQNQQNLQLKRKPKQKDQDPKKEQHPMTSPETQDKPESTEKRPVSPSQCSSTDMSEHNSSTATITTNDNSLALDDNFWSEVLSADNSGKTSYILPTIVGGVEQQFQFLFSPLETGEADHVSSSSMSDGMDFWYDVYTRAEEFTELPQL